MPIAIRWGLLLGLASMAWLYLTFLLGFHTSGVVRFQVVPVGWFVVTSVVFALALREAAGAGRPSFVDGLRTGATIAVLSAVIAIITQIVYFRFVHPAWPELMVEQARQHFLTRGSPAAEVTERVEEARRYFSLRSYATQSALAALVLGLVLSGIITTILRFTRRPSR
jgi:hypothetical protein